MVVAAVVVVAAGLAALAPVRAGLAALAGVGVGAGPAADVDPEMVGSQNQEKNGSAVVLGTGRVRRQKEKEKNSPRAAAPAAVRAGLAPLAALSSVGAGLAALSSVGAGLAALALGPARLKEREEGGGEIPRGSDEKKITARGRTWTRTRSTHHGDPVAVVVAVGVAVVVEAPRAGAAPSAGLAALAAVRVIIIPGRGPVPPPAVPPAGPRGAGVPPTPARRVCFGRGRG